MSGKQVPLAIRFERHYIPEPNSGCWLWESATIKSREGALYGVTTLDGPAPKKSTLAHRASYELFIGKIPDGLQVDHVCTNTLCVNPEHLQVLDQFKHARLTADRRLKGCCGRGHVLDEKNAWVENRKGVLHKHCRKCHAENEARKRAEKKRMAREEIQV